MVNPNAATAGSASNNTSKSFTKFPEFFSFFWARAAIKIALWYLSKKILASPKWGKRDKRRQWLNGRKTLNRIRIGCCLRLSSCSTNGCERDDQLGEPGSVIDASFLIDLFQLALHRTDTDASLCGCLFDASLLAEHYCNADFSRC